MIYVTLRRQEVLPVNADYYLRAAVKAQNASVSTSVTRFQQYSPDLAVVVEIQGYTLEYYHFILGMQIVLSQELESVKPWGIALCALESVPVASLMMPAESVKLIANFVRFIA